MGMIKAILKKPADKVGKEIEIENSVKGIQKALNGGYFEALYLKDNIYLLCDEEGKIKNLKPNLILRGDVIVGPVIVVGFSDYVSREGRDMTDCPISLEEWRKMIGA